MLARCPNKAVTPDDTPASELRVYTRYHRNLQTNMSRKRCQQVQFGIEISKSIPHIYWRET